MQKVKLIAALLVLALCGEASAQCRTCRPSSGRPRLFPRVFAPSATLAPTYFRPAPSYGYSTPSYQPAPVQYTIPQPVYSVAGYGRPVGYSFGGCPGGVCPR